MPYYSRYRKPVKRSYRSYNRDSSIGDRPDLWIQNIGMQLAYERARLDHQVGLRKENMVYSAATYEAAEQRLQMLMSTIGGFLGLKRALDGFHDLELIGTPNAETQTQPFYIELLAVKYNITDIAKVNSIRIRCTLLMEVYHAGYIQYSQRLNALPKIPTPTRQAMALPELHPRDDPRDLGLHYFQPTNNPMDLHGMLPNKWISSADDLNEGTLHDEQSQAAKRQNTNA